MFIQNNRPEDFDNSILADDLHPAFNVMEEMTRHLVHKTDHQREMIILIILRDHYHLPLNEPADLPSVAKRITRVVPNDPKEAIQEWFYLDFQIHNPAKPDMQTFICGFTKPHIEDGFQNFGHKRTVSFGYTTVNDALVKDYLEREQGR